MGYNKSMTQNQVRFIGDVHGKWSRYSKLIEEVPRSIQVGDFGVGFRSRIKSGCTEPPQESMSKGDHKFIRGNHDNPEYCRGHACWIPDGAVLDGKIFCVGGAYSIDKHYRTEGIDWWPDEELSYKELCEMLDIYEKVRPQVVVSHEAPECMVNKMCSVGGFRKLDIPSPTRKVFDNMLEIHRPELWIHGHWHVDYHTIVAGTEFIGLGELSHVDLSI